MNTIKLKILIAEKYIIGNIESDKDLKPLIDKKYNQ